MSSRAAAPRVLALATVAAIHAGALLVLLAETRMRLVRGPTRASPLLVMLFEPRERRPSPAPTETAARAHASRLRPDAAAGAEALSPASPAAPSSAIDWAAQATASAARQIEADERRARQLRALAPKTSPLLAARPKRPRSPWNYASTHRVEALPGLETVIHLNDECAIVLFLIVPIAGGCALEKTPARGDLFEHLHDSDPPDP